AGAVPAAGAFCDLGLLVPSSRTTPHRKVMVPAQTYLALNRRRSWAYSHFRSAVCARRRSSISRSRSRVMPAVSQARGRSPLPWRSRATTREIRPCIPFDFGCGLGVGALHPRSGSDMRAVDQVNEPRFGGYGGVRFRGGALAHGVLLLCSPFFVVSNAARFILRHERQITFLTTSASSRRSTNYRRAGATS